MLSLVPTQKGANMKKSFTFERELETQNEAVWKLLASLDRVDDWAPIITSCRLEGSGNGAKRYCTTADGGELVETILEVDAASRSIRYRVDEGLPLSSYEGVFRLESRGDKAAVVWTIEAEGDADGLAQVEGMLKQVAPAMLESLEQHSVA